MRKASFSLWIVQETDVLRVLDFDIHRKHALLMATYNTNPGHLTFGRTASEACTGPTLYTLYYGVPIEGPDELWVAGVAGGGEAEFALSLLSD